MSDGVQTVSVDLDGVLASYDGSAGVEHIGDPIPGAKEFISSIREIPARVCIYTTRTNSLLNTGHTSRELRQIVEDWLVKHDIPFDSIACDGKPLAVAYVDDRAVVCRPLKDVECQDYDTAYRHCRSLVNGHELGAQGNYSSGQLNDDDEGDIKIMLSRSKDGTVRLDFGKPVEWVAMSHHQAMQIAMALTKLSQ